MKREGETTSASMFATKFITRTLKKNITFMKLDKINFNIKNMLYKLFKNRIENE